MSDHGPTCTCDSITALKAAIEGRKPPACPVHDDVLPLNASAEDMAAHVGIVVDQNYPKDAA